MRETSATQGGWPSVVIVGAGFGGLIIALGRLVFAYQRRRTR